MRISSLVFLCFFLGCISKPEKEMNVLPKFALNADDVSFIKVKKDSFFYKITLKDSINKIINNMNESNIDYIKFGSSDYIIFYDLQGKQITKCYFYGMNFKNDGVVFKSKKIIIR